MNLLTVDVEEWFQSVLFDVRGELRTNLPGEVAEILSLLAAHGTKATFFVVGSLAEKYPGLVRKILDAGHEVGCHGWEHRLVSRMNEREFQEDTTRALSALRRGGAEVSGYRAPTWSISRKNLWALDALKSLGLKYDSSVYPRPTERNARFIRRLGDDFFEIPPSTFRLAGLSFPFAGGTFLRFCPAGFCEKKIAELNAEGRPAVVYFHSWEFGPKPAEIPAWKKFIQFSNAASVKFKISRLLGKFRFGPIGEHLKNA